MISRTNEYGMTFTEWLYAAGYNGNRTDARKRAWMRGEDPSDHRAAAVQSYPRMPIASKAARRNTTGRRTPKRPAKKRARRRSNKCCGF